MTDLLPSQAYQFTTKIDHHFNDAISLSGFGLRQVTHEANSNYNPVNKYVGSSYQLDRVIKTFVVNNTYVLNSSTVLTLRGGYNHFDDNYNLPYAFDAAALFNNPGADQPVLRQQPVPDDDDHRLQGLGLHEPAGQRLLPVRRQRHAEPPDGIAQPEGRRRLPHHRRDLAQLRRLDRHLHLQRRLQQQRARRPAARLSAGHQQRAAQHQPRRLRALLLRLPAGRLARQQQADDQLRRPPRARDRHAGEEQPADGELRSDRGQPAQQPGQRGRPGHRREAADPRRPGVRRRQRRDRRCRAISRR